MLGQSCLVRAAAFTYCLCHGERRPLYIKYEVTVFTFAQGTVHRTNEISLSPQAWSYHLEIIVSGLQGVMSFDGDVSSVL